MRLLGASFEKIAEKLNGCGSEEESKRPDFGLERAIGRLMPRFPVIGFQRKGALFVLYPSCLFASTAGLLAVALSAIFLKKALNRRILFCRVSAASRR